MLHGVSSEERRTRNPIKIQIANMKPPSGGFFFVCLGKSRCLFVARTGPIAPVMSVDRGQPEAAFRGRQDRF
jgi:hypothetical protein